MKTEANHRVDIDSTASIRSLEMNLFQDCRELGREILDPNDGTTSVS
jgi:hypothetical protein